MRKNQITISVMELNDESPVTYSAYCDSNDFCEALVGAMQMVVKEHETYQRIPEFGDKSLYKRNK